MEINATFVGQAVAFVIFVILCMKWVWPPLMKTLEKRQKEIADGLDYAEKAKKNLELAKSGAAETLRQAKLEAKKIVDDANAQRIQIIDRANEEATSEKNRILESAKHEIEAEKNKAREELRSEVVQLAIAGAEKILNSKVDSDADKKMITKLFEQI